MKRFLLSVIVIVCLSELATGQSNTTITIDCDLATNITCSSAIALCDDYADTLLTNPPGCDCVFGTEWIDNAYYRPIIHNGQTVGGSYSAYWETGLFYSFYVNQNTAVTMTANSSTLMMAIEIYGPFGENEYPCDAISAGENILYGDIGSAYTSNPIDNLVSANFEEGLYYVVFYPRDCINDASVISIDFDAPFSPCVSDSPPPCLTCIEQYSPQPGEEYVISGWVKENGLSNDIVSYSNSQIKISYPSLGNGEDPFFPSGKIIDGWQKIEGSFTIPSDALDIKVELLSSSSENSMFDDIRVQPFNSSMKTFVYDPVTMRLVAEQDERNYSTFYEYDEEGRLSRVKKETERGIQTVKSIRQNTAIDE